MTSPNPHPALELAWARAVPFAHRGLHHAASGVPENSLAAFARALSRGFAVELDVRLSAEGVPVVFHDETLARLTGAPGRAGERTAAELSRLRLCGTDQGIPTLAEVLDLVRGRVGLYVELKPVRRPGRLCRAVAGVMAGYGGPWLAASFDPRVLAWFRAHAAHVPRCRIAAHRPRTAADPADLLGQGRPHALALGLTRLPDHQANVLGNRGGLVLAWTVRTPAQARRALRHAHNYVFEGFVPTPHNP